MKSSVRACIPVRLPLFIAVSLLLPLVLWLSGCKVSGSGLGKDVLATVGGEPITVEDFKAACGGAVPEERGERKDTLARLINNRIAARAAAKEGYVADPALLEGFYNDRLPALLLKKIEDGTVVTEGELKAAKVNADMKPVMGVSMMVAPTMEEAEAAMAELRKGAGFKQTAVKYSAMKAETERDIALDNDEGIYPPGVMAMLNRMKPGELSPISKLDIGYAIFKMNYRKGPEEVWMARENDVRAGIKQMKAKAELAGLIDKLRSSGDVKLQSRKLPGGEVQYTGAVAGGIVITMDPRLFDPAGDQHFEHSGLNPKTVRDALNNRINEVLLSQEARRQGLDKDPGFQRELGLQKEALLAGAVLERVRGTYEPTRKDLNEYYEKNKDKYATKTQVRISRMLLGSNEDAEAALKELKAGKDFASVARDRSLDSASKDKGGDVGYVVPVNMKEPLKSSISKMKAGDISGVLKSEYGYEVLKATGRKEGVAPPMSNLSGTLKKRVLLVKQSERVEAFYDKLKEKTKVEVNDKLLETLK